MKKTIKKIIDVIQKKQITIFNLRNKRRLNVSDFTIICNDCIGGKIYHQLGLAFKSPTINLFFDDHSFLLFANNIEYYFSQPMEEVKSKKQFPQGCIDNIYINFNHYKTYDEAKESWNKRKERVIYDKIFVIWDATNSNRLSKKDIELFNSIPYPKIALIKEDIGLPFNNCCFITFKQPHFREQILTYWKNGRMYFNQFNFVKWFNASL